MSLLTNGWQPLTTDEQLPARNTAVDLTVRLAYTGHHSHADAVAAAVATVNPTGAVITDLTSWLPPAENREDSPILGAGPAVALADNMALSELQLQVREALDVLANGVYDGSHHKNWVLDRIARALTGTDYQLWAQAHPGWADLADEAVAP